MSEREPAPKEKREKKPSLLVEAAERKLLEQQAAEAGESVQQAQQAEAKKEAMIATEMQRINDIFESSDQEGLDVIEQKEQTLEEKIAMFEFAMINRKPITLTAVDSRGPKVRVVEPDGFWKGKFFVRVKGDDWDDPQWPVQGLPRDEIQKVELTVRKEEPPTQVSGSGEGSV